MPAEAEDARQRWWRLAEMLLLFMLLAGGYEQQRDPRRIVLWLFHAAPPLPYADVGGGYLAALRGVSNLFWLALVGASFSGRRWAEWIRTVCAGVAITLLMVIPTVRQIEGRLTIDEAPGNTAPYVTAAHDGGVLQTEMAADALLAGQDPYSVSYARPPMTRSKDSKPEYWQRFGYQQNPAFEHFPYLPGVLVTVAPLQAVSRKLFGAWDVRFLYLAALLALAAAVGRLVPAGSPRRMVWLLTTANPMLAEYLAIGRNDVLVLLPLALFGGLLVRERWVAAAWMLGVAMTFKQFAAFALPFLALAVWRRNNGDARTAARQLWPAALVPAVVILPFFAWNARDFLSDVLFFNVGSGPDAFPVRPDGYGLSALAYGLNLVADPKGPNPLGWFAAPAMVVTLFLLGRWVWRAATPERVLIASGACLYVALFTSRFFAENYLVVPALLWAIAWLGSTAKGTETSVSA